jgi:hypothetical protein
MSIKSLFSTKKRIAAIALSGAVILGAGGIAAAFYTSSGSGSGNASAGSASAYTVSVSADTSQALYPGSGSETLSYTITNNSAGGQALTAVTATVADSGSCLGSWFTAVASAPSPAIGTSIAAGGTATGTVTVTMQDSGTNQDACQGITSVPVTVHAA